MRVPGSAMSGAGAGAGGAGGEETERCTPAEALPRWTSAPPPSPTDYEPHAARHQSSPFAYDPAINERFALWHGDISTLEADIITNTTNEAMDERNPVSDRIFFRAGSSLKEEIFNEGKECRTGEVCVTGAHSLAARHLVHVVGPRYSPKYRAAAEHTLHSCYRNVLYKSQELGARTLALCVIHSVRRNFPPDVGAHIALRTIRRFMERSMRPCLLALVASDGAEAALLEALAPLYFPRSHDEARAARWRLPADVGGPAGEPHQPAERRIRIIHNPQHATAPHTHADDEGVELDASEAECYAEAEAAAAFARMHAAAPDTQRLLGTEPRYPPVADLMRRQIEQHERYERLLRRARSEDLSEVSGIGCLYRSGEDLLGRPVVVFVGKWFPVSDINLDKALLYLIQLLDPIVRGDYVIAYFHTLTSAANHPPFSWLKEVYTLLPYKYKKNLKAFYIVHPTFWTKMMTWWFTTFMAPAIKQKVHNLPGIEYLYAVMSRDQLDVPAFITEYDMTINGLHYFQPDSSST